jgi:hypothetical protein
MAPVNSQATSECVGNGDRSQPDWKDVDSGKLGTFGGREVRLASCDW